MGARTAILGMLGTSSKQGARRASLFLLTPTSATWAATRGGSRRCLHTLPGSSRGSEYWTSRHGCRCPSRARQGAAVARRGIRRCPLAARLELRQGRRCCAPRDAARRPPRRDDRVRPTSPECPRRSTCRFRATRALASPLCLQRRRISVSCRRATTSPACHPGARPAVGGWIDSMSIPLRAISHAITEFEFHMSPVSRSSRPDTGVGTWGTRGVGACRHGRSAAGRRVVGVAGMRLTVGAERTARSARAAMPRNIRRLMTKLISSTGSTSNHAHRCE
jgi:hypothetical protein